MILTLVCVSVCVLGEDSLHGAGQRPRRGSRSGVSVADNRTVRGFFCLCFIATLSVHAVQALILGV